MIATLCLATALTSTPAIDQQQQGWNLLLKTVKTYQNKLCATGNIVWNIKSPKDGLRINTVFQYMNPNRVYIYQQMVGGAGKKGLLVSDGKFYVFRIPNNSTFYDNSPLQSAPVREVRSGRLLTVNEIYIAGAQGLLDNSLALDFVMGREDNDIHLKQSLANVTLDGEAKVNGQDCQIVKAMLRPIYTAPPTIPITFAINSKNELVQITDVESYKIDQNAPIKMNMTWDIEATVNDETKVQEGLFKLPRK